MKSKEGIRKIPFIQLIIRIIIICDFICLSLVIILDMIQQQDCIFCKIASKKISIKIDHHCQAILPIQIITTAIINQIIFKINKIIYGKWIKEVLKKKTEKYRY